MLVVRRREVGLIVAWMILGHEMNIECVEKLELDNCAIHSDDLFSPPKR